MFKIIKFEDNGGIYIKIGRRGESTQEEKRTEDKPSCPKCGYRAKSAKGLKIHMATQHK